MNHYQQSLNAQQGIDYSQYLQGANQAGQAYSGLAGMAGQQAGNGRAGIVVVTVSASLTINAGAGKGIWENRNDRLRSNFFRTWSTIPG